MNSRTLIGWNRVYPKDKYHALVYITEPCLNKRRGRCEIMGECLSFMGSRGRGKELFKQCKKIKVKIITRNIIGTVGRGITILHDSPIKYTER